MVQLSVSSMTLDVLLKKRKRKEYDTRRSI